jgi:hypothetical protein
MVQHYYDENNYPRRALLLLGVASGHLPDTGKIFMTVDVKVEYLPQNTTSLLQPMEQQILKPTLSIRQGEESIVWVVEEECWRRREHLA